MGQRSASSSSIATSVVEDTSPENAFGKKSESALGDLEDKRLDRTIFRVFRCFIVYGHVSLTGCGVLFCPSATNVPAHLVHPAARAQAGGPEEALHREGDAHQRAPVSASYQTKLQVAGESLKQH